MRFCLDHNVPVSVRRILLEQGHDCWTASEAGLATEGQDDNPLRLRGFQASGFGDPRPAIQPPVP